MKRFLALAIGCIVAGCTFTGTVGGKPPASASQRQPAAWNHPTESEPPLVSARHYPTMLDMTSPEFEAAIRKSDIMLMPIGAIEEHGPHLPLGSDAIGATAQLFHVQQDLRRAGVETILGPPLNIGLTNEGGDWTRDGTYMYPGSLTVREDTFVALYVDVLRALHASGVRRVFLYSEHLGGRQLRAVARIAEEANARIAGISVQALIDSERLDDLHLKSDIAVLPIENGLNFEMLTRLLGTGIEPARSTHADGWETSLMLYFQPDAVRPGYNRIPQVPSSRFFAAASSGDRSKNPSGIGGFPLDRASAAAGERISDYRADLMARAILGALDP